MVSIQHPATNRALLVCSTGATIIGDCVIICCENASSVPSISISCIVLDRIPQIEQNEHVGIKSILPSSTLLKWHRDEIALTVRNWVPVPAAPASLIAVVQNVGIILVASATSVIFDVHTGHIFEISSIADEAIAGYSLFPVYENDQSVALMTAKGRLLRVSLIAD
jgi:hypothetical protein